MSHARQQIRDQVATTLTGLSLTGSTVYTSRVYPHDTLPSLAIYTLSEERSEDFDVMGLDQVRELTLTVEARAKATSDLDNTLDTICADVEAAIAADKTLGGLAQEVVYAGVEIELDGEAEKPTGVARLTLIAFYRVDWSDPETIIA